MREKHGLMLFITSCLSGCGQMYQGYMKRGLSLLLLFFHPAGRGRLFEPGPGGFIPAGGMDLRLF